MVGISIVVVGKKKIPTIFFLAQLVGNVGSGR